MALTMPLLSPRVVERDAFWAALFIVAIRRTRMKVQKEANARLREIAPGVVKFVEAKIGCDPVGRCRE